MTPNIVTIEAARERIGDAVLYRPFPGEPVEQGYITSVNDTTIFVRYGSDGGSKGTYPRDLTWLTP